MLWRALGHVDQGCYIDIGAQDPVVDSVSLAFYEHGWRGIHVEPTAHYARLLRTSRPEELVIQAAASVKGGLLAFYEFPGTGLSTLDRDIAKSDRYASLLVREIIVPCVTLSDIFSYCNGREVHWLKIDVEGCEDRVLGGWGDAPNRPWIIVVEATLPGTQEQSHLGWEPLVLEKGYRFAYFDGLSRFYVSEAHPELLDSFLVGPNVFDGFALSGTASSAFCEALNTKLRLSGEELVSVTSERTHLRERLDTADEALVDIRKENESLQHQLSTAQQQIAHASTELATSRVRVDELSRNSNHLWTVAGQLEQELQRAYASRSWRITRPLRRAKQATKTVASRCRLAALWAGGIIKQTAKPVVRWVMGLTLAHPHLKTVALSALSKRPRLKQQLREFAVRSGLIAGAGMALASGRLPSAALRAQKLPAPSTVSDLSSPPHAAVNTSERPSQLNDVNAVAAEPAETETMHAALVSCIRLWPLGRRVDG